MKFEQGPYIQTACFCEQVIEDKTGVLSLIRLIDTLIQSATGPDVPAEMPPLPYRMKLVITLKSGRARGRHELRVVPEAPSGTKTPIESSIYFEGEEKGSTLSLI